MKKIENPILGYVGAILTGLVFSYIVYFVSVGMIVQAGMLELSLIGIAVVIWVTCKNYPESKKLKILCELNDFWNSVFDASINAINKIKV